MPNKLDTFSIKFWILADLETKYCLDIIPYLGKDETRDDSLGTHVVMQFMQPYLGVGYNVTMNIFSPAECGLRSCWRKELLDDVCPVSEGSTREYNTI